MGELPMMTRRGTFVINGAERVIVSQLHRAPGICFEKSVHLNGKILHSIRIIPDRGSWLEVLFDTNDLAYVYLDRRRRAQDDERAHRARRLAGAQLLPLALGGRGRAGGGRRRGSRRGVRRGGGGRRGDAREGVPGVAGLLQAEDEGDAKTSMNSFLNMLRNAGLNINYDGLKAYYDADPRLQAEIQDFNEKEVVFVGDAEAIGTFGDLLGGPTKIDRSDTDPDATREILNRIKFGTEGALFTGVLGGVGLGIKKLRDSTNAGKATDGALN